MKKDSKIRVKYFGQWTGFMTEEYFLEHYKDRFKRFEAIETQEFMTKDELRKLYPDLLKLN